jgi:hypothetical protein
MQGTRRKLHTIQMRAAHHPQERMEKSGVPQPRFNKPADFQKVVVKKQVRNMEERFQTDAVSST